MTDKIAYKPDATMPVVDEEMVELCAQIAEDHRPGHGDTLEAQIEERVAVSIMLAIRALTPPSSAPASEGGAADSDAEDLARTMGITA